MELAYAMVLLTSMVFVAISAIMHALSVTSLITDKLALNVKIIMNCSTTHAAAVVMKQTKFVHKNVTMVVKDATRHMIGSLIYTSAPVVRLISIWKVILIPNVNVMEMLIEIIIVYYTLAKLVVKNANMKMLLLVLNVKIIIF